MAGARSDIAVAEQRALVDVGIKFRLAGDYRLRSRAQRTKFATARAGR